MGKAICSGPGTSSWPQATSRQLPFGFDNMSPMSFGKGYANRSWMHVPDNPINFTPQWHTRRTTIYSCVSFAERAFWIPPSNFHQREDILKYPFRSACKTSRWDLFSWCGLRWHPSYELLKGNLQQRFEPRLWVIVKDNCSSGRYTVGAICGCHNLASELAVTLLRNNHLEQTLVVPPQMVLRQFDWKLGKHRGQMKTLLL
jgi:hypothetical protein